MLGLGGGPVPVVSDAVLTEIGVTHELTARLSGKRIVYDLAADIAGEPKEPLVDALAKRARDLSAKLVIAIGSGIGHCPTWARKGRLTDFLR